MAKVINAALLANLFTAYNTAFRGGFAGVTPSWANIATEVSSSAGIETYSWMGQWPAIREWLGERVLKELTGNAYLLANKDYESTIRVLRNNIEDDQLGIYTPMFTEMGATVAAFPDQLVYAALAAGFVNKCYDGQPFFDTEHPVAGDVVSNMQDGANAPWFLLDTSRTLKPIIYQNRRGFGLTAMDRPTDDNVFSRKEFVYGVDGRANAGYGFWQMAYASKADLTADNYETARKYFSALKDDEGKPLGTKGTLLVVPGTLEGPGLRLLKRMQNAGTDNEWFGTAELLVAPYL